MSSCLSVLFQIYWRENVPITTMVLQYLPFYLTEVSLYSVKYVKSIKDGSYEVVHKAIHGGNKAHDE